MNSIRWQVLLGVSLMILSAAVYSIHFLLFRDTHHIFIYLIGDIGFVFIEVLMVTLIIHRLLSVREKRNQMEKLNIVIGAFFSEAGTHLLTCFSDSDPGLDDIRKRLIVKSGWTHEEFEQAKVRLKDYPFRVEVDEKELVELKRFLVRKRDFLVRMLENPTLLEHETFTSLLQAVFHVTEELENRSSLHDLPNTDMKHLAGDIKRAYGLLVEEWLAYMDHLKNNYPYLFSLAMRTNPFDRNASVIVT